MIGLLIVADRVAFQCWARGKQGNKKMSYIFTVNPESKKDLKMPIPADWNIGDVNFFLGNKPHLQLKEDIMAANDVYNVDVIKGGKLLGSKSGSNSALIQAIKAEVVELPEDVGPEVPAVVPNSVGEAISEALAAIPAVVKAVHVKTGGIAERTCVTCGKVFQYASKRGRPPVQCADCKVAKSA